MVSVYGDSVPAASVLRRTTKEYRRGRPIGTDRSAGRTNQELIRVFLSREFDYLTVKNLVCRQRVQARKRAATKAVG